MTKAQTTVTPLRPNAEAAKPRYCNVVSMSAADWITVRDNPRQRNTEQRAKRAKHLLTPNPAHSVVHAGRLPDGTLYKLDGHTRAYLWERHMVELPDTIHVQLWDCPSLNDIKELYRTFDNTAAVENVTDQIFGGGRELGFDFKSDVLRNNRYATAIRIAHDLLIGQSGSTSGTNAVTIYDLQKYWATELKLLDSVNPTRKRFNTGVLTAALLTLRRFGPDALEFWDAFAAGRGSKYENEVDPIQALEERLLARRAEGGLSGYINIHLVIRICLSAFDRERSGQVYTLGSSRIKAISTVSLKKWLTKARKKK